MNRIIFSSLCTRLLFLVILASLPALLLTVNNAIEDRNAATTQIQGETIQLTNFTVANQEQLIEGAHHLLIVLGNLPAVRDRNSTECSGFMAQIKKDYRLYANLFAVTKDGDLFCSAIPIKQQVNYAGFAWFNRAVSNRNFSIGDFQAAESIIKKTLSQHEGTAEDTGVDGVRRFFAFAPIHSGTEETGLFVSNGLPVAIAVAQVNRILFRDLAGLSIVILLMLVIAWFASDAFIMRHVNVLLRATERLGTGDLNVRTNLKYDIGEMGELARVFDKMAGSLQEREAQRKQAEEELRKHREHLEELVTERTAELNKKNEELEKFNTFFVGRELRMIELKKQIAELEKKIGSLEKTGGN